MDVGRAAVEDNRRAHHLPNGSFRLWLSSIASRTRCSSIQSACFRQGSSTRWQPTVAGSWSPMGTTTACCASRSMGRSVSDCGRQHRPTGLAISGNTIYMAEAGPVPHVPQDGNIVASGSSSSSATLIASGARLLVDVEFGRGRTLYALSQGFFMPGTPKVHRRSRIPARSWRLTATEPLLRCSSR